MKKLLFVFVFGVVLTAFSAAQFMMMGGGSAPDAFLLMRNDVKKELKITDDQQSKLDAAQQDMQTQGMQAFQDHRDDQPAMMAAFKKLGETLSTTVKGILTADQNKRLHEISLQQQGSMAIADPDTQKALKFTDDQIKKVKDLQASQEKANKSIRDQIQSGDLDRQDAMAAIKKNTDALKAAYDKVLTDDQKAALKKLQGAPFTMDPNEQAGFGGGRRVGGAGGGGN